MPAKESAAAQRSGQAAKAAPSKTESLKDAGDRGSATTGAAAAAEQAAETSREASEQAVALANAAAAQGQTWQEEAVRFMSLRLERQIDHFGALAACRSPVELLEIESRFAAQSFQDYLDETYRIMERAVDLGSGAIGAWPGKPPQATA